jgi:hypothetical protein
VKDWLSNGHPYPAYPNSPLFCGVGRRNTGQRISRHTIFAMYANYKKNHFPRLLQDPLVSEEDKRKICDLLQKPWNPYLRRHTAATEISKALKDSNLIDSYLGWSPAGNTRHKYQHYYADDSFDAMLTVMDGLKPPSSNVTNTGGKKGLLCPRQCPNCSESNKPENKFCSKCKFVLSYDAYNEVTKQAQERTKGYEDMQQRHKNMEEKITDLSSTLILDRTKSHDSTLLELVKDKGSKTSTQILQELVEEMAKRGYTLLTDVPPPPVPLDKNEKIKNDNNSSSQKGLYAIYRGDV